jgi:hypothetical protein
VYLCKSCPFVGEQTQHAFANGAVASAVGERQSVRVPDDKPGGLLNLPLPGFEQIAMTQVETNERKPALRGRLLRRSHQTATDIEKSSATGKAERRYSAMGQVRTTRMENVLAQRSKPGILIRRGTASFCASGRRH